MVLSKSSVMMEGLIHRATDPAKSKTNKFLPKFSSVVKAHFWENQEKK